MQEEGIKCNPVPPGGRVLEVVFSSHLMLNEKTTEPRSKITEDKNKCFFHTSAKKTSFHFFFNSFFIQTSLSY